MLTFQDHVLARPSESVVSCVNALSLLFIFQDLALGQGSQGWQSAMSTQANLSQAEVPLEWSHEGLIMGNGSVHSSLCILKPKVERF